MTNLLYVVAFAPSYLVIHAFAVRISRDLELTGRLQGRSTPTLFAGSMAVLDIVLVAVFGWAIGMPVSEATGAVDAVKLGVFLLVGAFVVSMATAAAVRLLPQRRRRGPRQRTNRVIAMLSSVSATTIGVGFIVLLGGAWLVAIVDGIGSFGVGDWLMVALLLPLTLGIAIAWVMRARRTAAANAKRLRASPASLTDERPRVLYLRPFNEEHRLFAESKTFETYLGDEIATHIGPLVALGNPTDRIVPEGAERIYCDDDNWQATVETLAGQAPCIVGVTSASPNTAWELNRVRELGIEQRLYLLSPPSESTPLPSEPPTARPSGRVRKALGLFARPTVSWLTQDWDTLSREVSFGVLPSSLAPAGVTTWDEFVDTLVACGYSVDMSDPGSGAVLGFEVGGNAVLLAQSAVAAADFVRPIATRYGIA